MKNRKSTTDPIGFKLLFLESLGCCGPENFQSCEEGCVYKQEEGADIEGQLACIQEAECNEFTVIECENTYGATNE